MREVRTIDYKCVSVIMGLSVGTATWERRFVVEEKKYIKRVRECEATEEI